MAGTVRVWVDEVMVLSIGRLLAIAYFSIIRLKMRLNRLYLLYETFSKLDRHMPQITSFEPSIERPVELNEESYYFRSVRVFLRVRTPARSRYKITDLA